MKQTLLVKHAVSGRMFFDSNKKNINYTLIEQGDGWLFEIHSPLDETLEALLECKEELNVFIFKTYEDQPTLKIWYYVKDGPVHYDKDKQQISIYAHSRIEYYPHEYAQ
ncbi:hypothetical protein I6N90_18520 [Paenibacillus sp. GSMTC-2017]|uniref:hypothetical protein n=1 Tax=Paenibacillus sp. GSMTC-2017 TaxID=2794350 RepID=UPI0018D8212C|nr:hypothetical protein [Paenibacillus sp. GSMTC-2017]MBH5319797.1 hypothetical protein [Paenibacillus sp. GSMTC-2017]